MVNINNENEEVDLEITSEEEPGFEDTELVEEEQKTSDKLKKMREKLALSEEAKKQAQDDLQRARADFLNARKRLDEERARDKLRYQMQHVLDLLPLCDSFQMAMNDTEAWEKADKAWRTGIEGIHSQLLRLLDEYKVKTVDPQGETFDPHKHEAVGTEPVEDEKLQDKVISVVQKGYEMTLGETTETIRPARVTTGTIN